MPSRDGLQIDEELDGHLASRDIALQDFVQQIQEQMNNPKNIVTGGKSLAENSESLTAPRGTLRLFYGSWGEALFMKGWKICDGTGGTPQIHPTPGGDVAYQRFLKATAWGQNAGTVYDGGSHSHPFTEPGDHTLDIANHNDIDMSDSNVLAAHPQTNAVAGSDFAALIPCTNTNHYGTASISAHDPSASDVTHSGSSVDSAIGPDPANITVIVLMKI